MGLNPAEAAAFRPPAGATGCIPTPSAADKLAKMRLVSGVAGFVKEPGKPAKGLV
jgi:hypothetical protein